MRIAGYEMRAVGEPLVLASREVEAPERGEVVVEIAGCGVCHTDLGFLYDGVPTRHPLPLVLGHEVAGVVVDEERTTSALLGRQVIVPAVIPCGECDLCRRGRGDICPKQKFIGCDSHGGFASHVVVPGRGVCVVPAGRFDKKSLASLSVVADAVSTAYQAVRRSGLSKGGFAVFVGVGGVGGFGVQIARSLGARVLAIDVDPEKLAALSRHGAEWTLDARGLSTKDVRKKARAIADAASLPAAEWRIFETSGTKAGQECAFSLLTHGAVLGVVGYHPGDVTLRLSNLMAFAARAEGTWGCTPELFPEALSLVLDGRVAVEPFVEFHPMSEINTVLEKLRRHELARRAVLIPDFDAESDS